MVIPLTYGRMGNFLFQAATAMAYAWDHGLEYTLPSTTAKPRDNPIYLQHLVNPNWNPNLPSVTVTEIGHGYQEIRFKKGWSEGNIILDGYWQSEKYFKRWRKEILDAFGFSWQSKAGIVSVHVRRGDYLTIKRGALLKHPPVTQAWYERAMLRFPGYTFAFFSDDMVWCRAAFEHRPDCFFPGGAKEEDDLLLMAGCEHHICSASTFSWWGAWLNQNHNKRVVIPAHWITPGWANLDTKDIVPAEWEKLP